MGSIQIMKKYIKVRMFKKDTVYTMFTINDKGIEMLDVVVEKTDHEKEVIIVREICDVYLYTLTFKQAEEQLLQQVFNV